MGYIGEFSMHSVRGQTGRWLVKYLRCQSSSREIGYVGEYNMIYTKAELTRWIMLMSLIGMTSELLTKWVMMVSKCICCQSSNQNDPFE